MSIDIQLNNALSKQNIRVSVPSTFTIGVTTDPDKMGNAAERLLGLNNAQMTQLTKEIIFGQMRLVVATMRAYWSPWLRESASRHARELELRANGQAELRLIPPDAG